MVRNLKLKGILVSVLSILLCFGTVFTFNPSKAYADTFGLLTMDTGAYLKTVDNGGLRLRAVFDEDVKTALEEDGTKLFFKVMTEETFTVANGDYSGVETQVEVDKSKIYTDGKGNYFANCLLDYSTVEDDAFDDNFCAVAYITDGESVQYATFENASQVSKNLYEVVNTAMLDDGTDDMIENLASIYDFIGTAEYPFVANTTAQYNKLVDRINANEITPTNVKIEKGVDTTQKAIDADKQAGIVVNKLSSGYSESQDGTVTLKGVSYNEAYSYKSVAQKINNSYMGFEGNYGVGTYMDFYFTGNNMPTVMFFADNFNGNMTNYSSTDGTTVLGQKGVIVTPGFGTGNSTVGNVKNGNVQRFTIYGPNRLASSTDGGQTVAGNAGNHNTAACVSYAYQTRVDGTTANSVGAGVDSKYGTFDMFVQGLTWAADATKNVSGLISEKYATTNFRYTVGVENSSGKRKIVAKMYVVDGQTETLIGEINSVTKIDITSLTATNIIVYAAVKQDGSDTVFKYNAPHTI